MVPITTRPVGCTPCAAIKGRIRSNAPRMALPDKQQFGDEILFFFEELSDLVHGGNHVILYEIQGLGSLSESRLCDLNCFLGVALDDRFIQLF